jgi:large-conductance mechanosensitive channel
LHLPRGEGDEYLKRREAAAPAKPAADSKEVLLLEEIRDLLRHKQP